MAKHKRVAIEIKDFETFAMASFLFPEEINDSSLEDYKGWFITFGYRPDGRQLFLSPTDVSKAYGSVEDGPQITLKYLVEK